MRGFAPDWAAIAAGLARAHGLRVETATARTVSGGDISAAYRLKSSAGEVFVKLQTTGLGAMFDAEADGLALLGAANALRVPRVLGRIDAGGVAVLALEFIEPGADRPDTQRRLGRGLAALHANTAERYGLDADNYIGSTPQMNRRSDDWVAFLRERRLGYQLDLCRQLGRDRALRGPGQELLGGLDKFFADYRPPASLLHGDLWGGNWFAAAAGEPVIFDPAVYYGDPESDLAMTELFGGFGGEFYAAYRESRPERPGDGRRRDLYRLYHVLNHVNLFGGGYASQALALMQKLLA